MRFVNRENVAFLVRSCPPVHSSLFDPFRFEDLLSQEQEVASALWAAVGLPPISPYASATAFDGNPKNGGQQRRLRSRRLILGDVMSRATVAVRDTAFPAECRARLASCEDDPACQLELLR